GNRGCAESEDDRVDHFLRVNRVRHVERNEMPALRWDDGDGRACEKAVRQQNVFAIGSLDRGVAKTLMPHPSAGGIADLDEISEADVAFEFERNAAGDVAHHVLQGEADDGRGHCGRRENAGDVDALVVEDVDDDGDVAGDDDHFADEAWNPGAVDDQVEDRARDDLDGGQSDQRNRNLAGEGDVQVKPAAGECASPNDEPKYEEDQGGAEAPLAARHNFPKCGRGDEEEEGDPGEEVIHGYQATSGRSSGRSPLARQGLNYDSAIAKLSRAAATVRAMSDSVCAAEMKKASNCDGGR